MDALFVRVATIADVDVVECLEADACAEEKVHRGSWVRPPGTDSEGTSRTYVGGLGETIFGAIRVRQGDDNIWGVELLHVEQGARGVGIGDALLSRVLTDLAAEGAGSLTASAQPGDRSLKNLFERHGLVAQTILVGREL